ncbi:hypothetical protein ACIQXQ_05310 [Peribacillus sp. NPDC097198]|uniref:hypothetical protein n=1 Tax=Peribacillus sp. NPDC097198 TaxID=3364397 RepID=UPI0037F5B16C
MNEWMPLVSAGIGGLVAIIVVLINQVMTHIRWKEGLKRKGEDKYIDKKLEVLHESVIEFFIMANKSLELSRVIENGGRRNVRKDINILDNEVRTRIANSSPYLDSDLEERVHNVYEILVTLRWIEVEDKSNEEEIITNLLWLNEELHLLKEDLENIMKGFHSKKKDSNELNWFVIFSTILNLILLTYIFI